MDDVDASSGEPFLTVVGQEAHIRSSKKGGPRHDPAFPKEKLDAHENLILLCSKHHTMIDSNGGAGYRVSALIEMREIHERKQQKRTEIEQTVRYYVADQYTFDDKIQFQQADLHGPSVEAMFVDVPFSCRPDSKVAELMTRIATAHPGDPEVSEIAEGQVVTGGAQALLHPEWSASALVVGGPGQGKSTLLQYVCQFHRARFLGKENYGAADHQLVRTRGPLRVPIRLDLRKYALWASRASQKPKRRGDLSIEGAWPSIEEYVASEITQRSGGRRFRLQDLAVLVGTEPVLMALDGLDEVANLQHREQVSREIVATHGRLNSDSVNLVILVATRPGGATSALSSSQHFPPLYLRRLSQGLRLQYLQQWSSIAGLSPNAKSKLQSTFMDHQHVPHIRELASSPMQLAILLHLLYKRALLPQQRTELYREYLKTFLDREQADDKEPLLASERKVIEDIHAYLGWYLQTKAEEGTSSGSIERSDLERIVQKLLSGRAEGQKLAEKLFSAISTRVLCLVERDTGSFQFEVQSLREYFAALYIFDNAPTKGSGNSRDDCLNALLERPYWSNVTRFFVGMFSGVEVRGISENLRQVSARVDSHPMMRSMAALILDDRTYEGQTDGPIQEVVDFILEGPGVLLAEDGLLAVSGTALLLAERAGRAQAVQHLKVRLEKETSETAREAIVSSLRRHASGDDDLRGWWWSHFEPTLSWLETAAALGALTQIDSHSVEKLEEILRVTRPPSAWVTELLIRGRFDGASDEVLMRVRDELNQGAGEIVATLGRSTPAEKLIDGAMIAQLRTTKATAQDAIGKSRRVRTRARRNGTDTILSNVVAASDALRARPKPSPTSTATEWREWFAIVARAWGTGWVLHRTIAVSPPTIDLYAVAATLHDDDPPALGAALRDEAEWRSNKSNIVWWGQQLDSAASQYARGQWAVALLTTANPQVVAALANELSDVADELDPKCFTVAREALLASSRSLRTRKLNLQNPLRLNQVKFSTRALWLLRPMAGESTIEQLDKRLVDGFEQILRTSHGDMRDLVRLVGGARTVKVDLLRGARQALPGGGWASDIRLGAMNRKLANEILYSPADWPSDLTQIAANQVTGHLASRSVPLSEVAAVDHWFAEGTRA